MTGGRVLPGVILSLLVAAATIAAPIDVSDAAIERFLACSFQFDYTTITGDSTLRRCICGK